MVHFVGAGPGAADLITLRGKSLLEQADVIIYAGSLVNPELLHWKKETCEVYNSAKMTLEEVIDVICAAEEKGLTTVRLHTGDPCLYGAVREQMDQLDALGIPYDSCPGVSAFCGAAAALDLEYTLPGISQSVIITRMAGRTPVPERETLHSFASHKTSMILFLSTGLLEKAAAELIAGGLTEDTPAVIVYKATWPDEKSFRCTVGTMAACAEQNHIKNTALIIVGDAVNQSGYRRSDLYNPEFTTMFRDAK
ncbi:MAG: precorrin-4 C(11)-methyltransferase [Lachnospiraceae bacterium]